jgi:protein-S-isoprenylcysteine O-methyltransferase Ste14
MHVESPASVAAGAIVAFYWFKVLQLVDRAKRRTGAAGLVPREPIGRATRLIWTPVILIWIILPVLTGLHRQSSTVLRPMYQAGGWGWIAVAVMAAGFAATAACWMRMGKSWRMGIDPNVGILHIGLLQWEARREERYLLAVHGPVYAAYCRRVGGFLPRRSGARLQPEPARR